MRRGQLFWRLIVKERFMLTLGIVLVILSVVGIVVGIVNMSNQNYNGLFESAEEIDKVCKQHIKPVGTPSGTACAIPIPGVDGKIRACRRGVVNELGNNCVSTGDGFGAGLCAGSVLVLVAAIIVLFIPSSAKSKAHKSHKK